MSVLPVSKVLFIWQLVIYIYDQLYLMPMQELQGLEQKYIMQNKNKELKSTQTGTKSSTQNVRSIKLGGDNIFSVKIILLATL